MSAKKLTVEDLAEEFVSRLRGGENVSVSDYLRDYPMLSAQIAEFFPALQMLERLKQPNGKAGMLGKLTVNAIKRIGDYRIIRELGRGGMGVVFEAEQESLGRHVALKVLIGRQWLSPTQQKRFLHEASSAACLHHTNIVPVFGVGDENGLQYYVMQFIRGISLDKLIHAISRSSAAKPDQPAESVTPDRISAISTSPQRATSDDLPERSEDGASQCVVMQLQGKIHDLAESRARNTGYYDWAARICMQIAKAIQYAHEQGVVHRDIKPSNLLLDYRETAWVTDFGVAKTNGHEELTETGDLLGTLRYMGPEQFEGRTSPLSDIYSLGLTFYELLTLRPAYDAVERSHLIKQITSKKPTKLRTLDRSLPQDLETIVQKMIDRNTNCRYQSAKDVAEDLQCFLDRRPIRARRLSPVHTATMWAKRSPAAASLFALLLFLAVGSPILAAYLGRLVIETKRAYGESKNSLYMAKRSEAAANRFGQRPGQQFQTLKALAVARTLHVELGLGETDLTSMREEAIAALSLPDLAVLSSTRVPDAGRASLVAFDADLTHYTSASGNALSIRRVEGDGEVASLLINPDSQSVMFSPDGERLCVTSSSDTNSVQVWDWRGGELLYQVAQKAMFYAVDFSPDGRRLAVGHTDGSVSLHDLHSLKQTDHFKTASAPMTVGFHPTKPLIAINCQTAYCTQVWDFSTKTLERTLNHPSDVFGLQWSPNGKLLATVEGFDIYLWEMTESKAETPLSILRGHTWVVSEVNFHPSGRFLYSHSWREGRTRVWDAIRGKQLFSVPGYSAQFSKDALRLGFRTSDEVGVWKVSEGAAYIWPGRCGEPTPRANFSAYDSSGKLLAVAGDDGLYIWDTQDWQLKNHTAITGPHAVIFSPDKQEILVAHDAGVSRIAYVDEDHYIKLMLEEPLEIPDGTFGFHLTQTQDAQVFATDLLTQPDLTSTGQAIIFRRTGSPSTLIEGDQELRYLAIHPDGDWIVVGNWMGNDACVFDVDSGTLLQRLPSSGSTSVAVSSDGSLAATRGVDSLTLWDTRAWKKVLDIELAAVAGAVQFSPDSSMLAVTTSGSGIRLYDTRAGRLLATLATNHEPAYVRWLDFRPDGGQLSVNCAADGIRIWDLHALHEGLREVGLDWAH